MDIELTKDDLTLEERTRCRLFSRRAIKAVAKHQYAEFTLDDDAVNEIRIKIADLVKELDHDHAAFGIALALNDHLSHSDLRLVSKITADIGLVLDVILLNDTDEFS